MSVIEFSINQDRAYFDLIKPQYISWEFYSQYLDKTPPFGAIGDIVDCRTYRRFIPELNRRERAVEAFLRVTDYNMSLVSHLDYHQDLVREAELMFDALFNLKVLPSNRSRWVGGTESVKKHPAGIFNCSFTAINRLEAFGDIFNLLCLGVGAGYRVFKRDIKSLPPIKNKNLKIEFEEYKPVPKGQRLETTEIFYPSNHEQVAVIEVGDSREGWCDSILTLLKTFTTEYDVDHSIEKVVFNFDSVRPFGERILGFGGKASGYQALQGILQEIHKIVTECPDNYLRSIDCMDICCATARGVIAGSSRRSALICLFDEDDELCRNAKTDWELLEDTGKTYRSQSNNTCCIGSIHYDSFIQLLETDPSEDQVLDFLERVKPKKSFFDNAFQVMRTLGEPALDHFLLMVYKRYLAARQYRTNEDWHKYVDVCTNPCFTGDTLILTKQGHFAIKDLVGKTVEVWDGNNWVEIDNFRITGYDEAVYTITLHSGQTITATAYHEFIVEGKGRVQLKDLKNGDKLLTHNIQVHGEHQEKGAYLKGFLFGDGTSSKDHPKLSLYAPKYCCADRLILSGSEIDPVRYSAFDILDLDFGAEIPNNSKPMQGLTCRRLDLLPWVTTNRDYLDPSILNWDLRSKVDFIAGLLDADGYANNTGKGFSCQITSVYKQPLEMIQLLLLSIGVESTFRLKNDASRADGYQDFGSRGGRCKVQPAYRLTINQSNAIKLFKQIKTERLQAPDFEQKNNFKSKAATIVDIKFSHIAEEVYCCTVHTNNQVSLSNGTVTGQCHEINGTIGIDGLSGSFCNLTTNDLVKCVKYDPVKQVYYFDYDECKELVELMTRIGVRQTEVTIPMKGWNETQRKERLLGVDAVNGFQDAIALLGWEYDDENSSDLRRKIRQWSNDEATRYSAKLGIERPLLVTCVKPNGNTGTVLGVSSGVHWGWDKYYMRRVTCNSQDSLSKTLLDQGFTAYPANNDKQLGTKLQKMFFKELDPDLQLNSLLWSKERLSIVQTIIRLIAGFIGNNLGLVKIPFVARKLEEYGCSLIDQYKHQFSTQTLLDYFVTLTKEAQLDILNSCNSIVFEFPIKTTANKSCNDVSAIDQLRNQFLFSTEYTDHFPSVTITVKSHEWEDVCNWVFEHWNKGFITASFFSFFEESYPLLAYQSISESEYLDKINTLFNTTNGVERLETDQGTKYVFKLDETLLNKYESDSGFKEEEDLKVDNCTTGCPIK